MRQEHQPRLLPKTTEERIKELEDALKKYGKHTMYCCWSSDGYYVFSLGCTCGLQEVLDETK